MLPIHPAPVHTPPAQSVDFAEERRKQKRRMNKTVRRGFFPRECAMAGATYLGAEQIFRCVLTGF
jgi:hypothetical protein